VGQTCLYKPAGAVYNGGVLSGTKSDREEMENMNLWKRLLSFVLCGMVIMSCVHVRAAENEPFTVVMEAVELPTIETSAQQLGFLGLDADGNPQLKEGNYEKWIDRVDFTDAPYGLSFYQWLEENGNVDAPDGLLIDPTGAKRLSSGQYVYLVTQINGTGKFDYTGDADADAQNAWNAVLPTVTANEKEAFAHIIAAYSAFDRDHGEIFWLSGQSRMLDSISYGYNSRGAVTFTQSLYFVLKSDDFDIRSIDFRNVDAIKSAISDLYGHGGRVDAILAGVDADANRYEKIKYFNHWLTRNNHYNASTPSDRAYECISALTGAYGVDAPVCEGYSRAMQVLCRRAGIPCVLVDGMAYTGGTPQGHMWNYVAMEDGNWYAVDVTWDDPYTGSDSTHVSGYENEKYLLVGADTVIGSMAFLQSHPVTNAVTVNGLGFVNGPVLSSGAYDPATAPEPMVVPALKGHSFSLSFEDEILVNFYYTVSDATDIAQQGMLVFHEDPGNAEISKADGVYEADYVAASGRYIATSDGIAAKEMGDDRYYCAYARLTDGSYAYSPLYQYSPKKYAANMLGRPDTSVKQKVLCVAMLNYGAAAQNFFGYRTDDLMNAALTEEQKAWVAAYDEALFAGAVAADPDKVGSFVKTDGFGSRSATVSFEGAFAINYYFAPNGAVAEDMKLYIWDSETYAAVSRLTADNASRVVNMEKQSGGVYWGRLDRIAPKALDDTYYVAGVYTDANGITCCTGVIAYSLSKYCMNNAFGNMGPLAQATAMYGYYAAQYFEN
jgi:hypothetical protein